LVRPEERQERFVATFGQLVRDHFPPELDDRLPVTKRLSVQALRAGDRLEFNRIQDLRRSFSTTVHTIAICQRNGRLLVRVRATLEPADRPTMIKPGAAQSVRAGKRPGSSRIQGFRRTVSAALHSVASGQRGADLPAPSPGTLEVDPESGLVLLQLPWPSEADERARELLPEELGTVAITIRHRTSGVEWPVHTQHPALRDAPALVAEVEAEVDTSQDAFGAPLESGIWDVQARIAILGEQSIRRVPVPEVGINPGSTGSHPSSAYRTKGGTLAFKVPVASSKRPGPGSGTEARVVTRRE
jgi:hypothetical protein